MYLTKTKSDLLFPGREGDVQAADRGGAQVEVAVVDNAGRDSRSKCRQQSLGKLGSVL
jgi:hypothetical protein